MERNFERFMNLLEGIETSFIQRVENEEKLNDRIRILESELSEKSEKFKSSSGLVKENELLKMENENLTAHLEDLDEKIKVLNSTRNESVMNLQTEVQNSRVQLERDDTFNGCFLDTFKSKIDYYKSNVDKNNRDQVLLWAKNLIEKMEADNKWLLSKIDNSDKSTQDLISREADFRVKFQKSEEKSRDLILDLKNNVEFSLANKHKMDSLKHDIKIYMEKNPPKPVSIHTNEPPRARVTANTSYGIGASRDGKSNINLNKVFTAVS